ncbi:MAG TPA: DUF2163 domain-containing protein [Rickettsiales bacterium]|nr:DUF2163 domain-containing protein [Rickettsiales bacterium]
MKTIADDLKSSFEENATNIVKCWTLTLKDGSIIGFTTNSEDFTYSDIKYNSFSSDDITNIESNLNIEEDSFEFSNMISSDLIAENDIISGKYDNAIIEIFLIDIENQDNGKVVLLTGTISDIECRGDIFTAKVKGLKDAIDKTIGEVYSPLCRCRFCDTKCGLEETNFTFSASITYVSDAVTFITDDTTILSQSSGFFDNGIIEFTSGNNSGQKMEIKQYASGTFILSLNLPNELTVGDEFNVIAGCDKKFTTCCDTFDNAVNFRGEPHLPGIETLLKVM